MFFPAFSQLKETDSSASSSSSSTISLLLDPVPPESIRDFTERQVREITDFIHSAAEDNYFKEIMVAFVSAVAGAFTRWHRRFQGAFIPVGTPTAPAERYDC